MSAYRYIAADLAYPSTPVADLPLTGVTWGRMLNGAGEFSGKLKLPPLGADRFAVAHESVAFLDVPGSGVATTPHHAGLAITGDIDLRVFVALDDWTPAANNNLLCKWVEAGNQRSWLLRVQTSGIPIFNWSTTGTDSLNLAASVAPTVADGAGLWLRVTFDVDNGASGRTATFYTSPANDGVVWTQLGTPATSATVTSIFNATGAPITVGGRADGSSINSSGNYSYAEVRNGIAGTIVASPDFRPQTAGAPSFLDAQANTWSVTAPASIQYSTPPSTTYEQADNSAAILLAGLYREATDRATKVVYVLRDGVPLGCYIIWSQGYSAADQSITISGAELFSYARRRIIEDPSGELTVPLDYPAERPIDIAAALLTAAGGANMVLDVASGGGATVDKTYRGTDNRVLADEILELAALDDGGFDFRTDVRLTTSGDLERVWIAREFLGGTTEVVAKYGTNVAALGVTRRGDLRANDAVVFGPTQAGDSTTRDFRRRTTAEWAPVMTVTEAHSNEAEPGSVLAKRAVSLLAAAKNHELLEVAVVGSAIDAQLGTFHPGDVMRLAIPPNVDPFFHEGLDTTVRLLRYSVKVPDEGAGTEVVTLTLGEA